MQRVEWIERLQYLSLGFAVIGLIILFISWTSSNQPLIILAAIAIVLTLLAYNVLHFLKIDSVDDLMERAPYTQTSVLGTLFLETSVLLALLYGYVFPNVEQKVSEGEFSLLIWGVVPGLLAFSIVWLNLYLPSSYRMQELHRKAKMRQGQALIALREDIQRRTEQLLALGILPELQRATQGREVSPETLEEAVRLALDKIGGIEHILQYMILDKYLELLEGAYDSVSRGVLRKWAARAGAFIVAVYEVIMAILALLGAWRSLGG